MTDRRRHAEFREGVDASSSRQGPKRSQLLRITVEGMWIREPL